MTLKDALAQLMVCGLLTAAALAQAPVRDPLPYKNPRLSTDARVKDLLSRMTLEEKFWQLFMSPGDLDDPAHDYSHGVFGLQISTAPRPPGGEPAKVSPETAARLHAGRINAIQRFFVEKTRLGIPIIPFDEALHGLAQPGSTVFPQAIGLAATWDRDLLSRVAGAIAREARSRGIRQVLSPVVNIADDVRWGRVEETYGEDPLLASVMGEAFVVAFERAGIVTTPKHFVANVGEGGRDSYPVQHSDRLLAERYLPPFETAVLRAGARSIMTAYNSVDGLPATQNPRLLSGLLKGEWGFRGFVISDASATGGATVLHMTEPDTPIAAKHAFEAGLDVVFQSAYPQFRPYWNAVSRGLVSEAVIDAAVDRVLRAKFDLGLFEQPYVDAGEAARWNGHAEHRALARESARASIVLLKNGRRLLPFILNARGAPPPLALARGRGFAALPSGPSLGPQAPRLPRRLAVIGVDASEARLGGYSGPGIAPVSILEGIRQKLGSRTDVRYAAGPGRSTRTFTVVPSEALSSSADDKPARGLRGEYFDNIRLEGQPRIVRTDPRMDFRWTLNSPGRGIPFDWYSVRWTGSLTAPLTGVQRLAVEGNDGYRLYLDDRLVIDNWKKQSYGVRTASVDLKPGAVAGIRLEYFESTGNARLKLLWDAGVDDDNDARIAEAAELARSSDAVVVVAGLEEGEFRDRASLGVPGRQEDLILRLAATGTPLIVILIGGSAVTMTRWIDKVDAQIGRASCRERV